MTTETTNTNPGAVSTKNKSSDLEEMELSEKIVPWILRYLVIPIVVSVIAGVFALEVIDRQIESKITPIEAQETQVYSIFETLIAQTPAATEITETAGTTVTPAKDTALITESTPTLTPTPTRQQSDDVAFKPASCGQVPAGWQQYSVRWGDTLYSLARRSGTSIAQIVQVNCIYSGLKANTTIWLPHNSESTIPPVDEPEGTLTETPSITPTPLLLTETPSVTPSPTLTMTPTQVVDRNPPDVTILSPAQGLRVWAYYYVDEGWVAELSLSGSSIDQEEGQLPAQSYVWTTNQSTLQEPALGTGAQITVRLFLDGCEEREHTIQLSVTDSAGNVGQDQVSVFVAPIEC